MRLIILQLLLAVTVANARNDPPPSSDRTWAPPKLPKYEQELAGQRFNNAAASRVSINIAITSMLTLIAYRFAIDNQLPRLPYMTRLDAFILMGDSPHFLFSHRGDNDDNSGDKPSRAAGENN
jgi:hypothetical protein